MEQVLKNGGMLANQSSSMLWESFIKSFVENIKKTDKEDFEKLKGRIGRTSFLKYNLMSRVAEDLNLRYGQNEEFLRVDYTFYQKAKHGFEIPAIVIESENDFDSTPREALKLLSLNAPLKVLILHNLTTEELDEFIYEDECEWDYMIEAFSDASANVGYFAVVIVNSSNVENINIITKVYDTQNYKIEKAKKIEITNSN